MKLQKKMMILGLVALVMAVLYVFWNLDLAILRYSLTRRIPRLIALVLTATMIAIASLLFQTITNNRILTPNALGLDSLYVMGQTLIVMVTTRMRIVTPNSTINFLISTTIMGGFSLILYRLLFKERQNMYLLLLIGAIFGTLFRSLTGFFQMILDPNEFALLQGRLFASFNNIQSNLIFVALILFLLLIPFIYDYFQSLDVLLLGREQALNLGIDYNKITQRIFLVVVILTAISTALVGPITFLGLLVVNLSYEILKTYKHIYLMIGAILISIIALVGGQLILERWLNFSIPLSVIINLVGGTYFVYLLIKERSA
jgi:ABC-type enterochelin transport system, permease component